ncbi:hypothetical protein Tco_0137590, partial [Tanacetum coccineum]
MELKNKDVNSFSKTILDTESANNEDPEGIVAASKTHGKSKGTATKFTPLRSAQTPVQDTLHLPAVDGCDLSTDETNVFSKSVITARREKILRGRHLNRIQSISSQQLSSDLNVESGECSRRIRRQRDLQVGDSSKSTKTKQEVVTTLTTDMSWGARAKIVRPEGKLKNKDVNSFSKTILDTESANNEDPEGIVAASKTRGKSKGTATKFTPLRSAQTPVQDTLHLPAV